MNFNKKREDWKAIEFDRVLSRKRNEKRMFLSNARIKRFDQDYERKKARIRKEYLEMSMKIKLQVIDVKKFNKCRLEKKKGKKKVKESMEMKLPQIKKCKDRNEDVEVDRTFKCTKNRKNVFDSPDEYSSDISSGNSSLN